MKEQRTRGRRLVGLVLSSGVSLALFAPAPSSAQPGAWPPIPGTCEEQSDGASVYINVGYSSGVKVGDTRAVAGFGSGKVDAATPTTSRVRLSGADCENKNLKPKAAPKPLNPNAVLSVIPLTCNESTGGATVIVAYSQSDGGRVGDERNVSSGHRGKILRFVSDGRAEAYLSGGVCDGKTLKPKTSPAAPAASACDRQIAALKGDGKKVFKVGASSPEEKYCKDSKRTVKKVVIVETVEGAGDAALRNVDCGMSYCE